MREDYNAPKPVEVFIPPARRGRPSIYRPEMCDWAREAGALGLSIKGIWAYFVQEKGCNVPLTTFQGWYERTSNTQRPEFREAIKEAQALAQRRFEEIGQQAAKGEIKNHSSGTYQFIVKNRFRSDYKDEVHQKIEARSSVKIDAKLPPQIAAQRYKDLILNAATTAEEFFDGEL